MSTPRVTVLMSVHNGGPWLRAAVHSILAQTWRDFEFLILDDASTDDSVAQLRAFADPRIRLVQLPENIGLTASLNRGLREARAEFVARQDADDLSRPERLARQVAFLDAHPAVALVGSEGMLIDPGGRSMGRRHLPREPVALRWLSLLANPILHTAAMFRTSVVRDELGGYDESFPCCQDYDLWARVLDRHDAGNLAEPLVAIRERAGSIRTSRHAEAQGLDRRVALRSVKTWLPELALTESEVDLLCAYRRHLTAAEVAPFHRLLARVDAAFAVRFPEAAGNRDLARTRALVFAGIGYNLLPAHRGAAAREFLRCLRLRPAALFELPWARMLALALLGESARGLYSRLFSGKLRPAR